MKSFHYWNGWRLRGADYPSSQWFQEGFTEYAANLALVSGGLDTPEAFHARLAAHVTKYRKLATPLDAPGTRKGPPLYSGGALVAFIWDTRIREATGGTRGFGDLMRAVMRQTEGGARPYAWADIEGALDSVAPGDWKAFEQRYIHGEGAATGHRGALDSWTADDGKRRRCCPRRSGPWRVTGGEGAAKGTRAGKPVTELPIEA